MMEPKAIFWAKPLPAQNDGLCQALALPFCARNFKGDFIHFFYNMRVASQHRRSPDTPFMIVRQIGYRIFPRGVNQANFGYV